MMGTVQPSTEAWASTRAQVSVLKQARELEPALAWEQVSVLTLAPDLVLELVQARAPTALAREQVPVLAQASALEPAPAQEWMLELVQV
jgi:hypothetical protein